MVVNNENVLFYLYCFIENIVGEPMSPKGGEGYYAPTWGPSGVLLTPTVPTKSAPGPGRAPAAHMTPPLYLGKGIVIVPSLYEKY